MGGLRLNPPPHRPHNSLYVVSDEGALAARYDKRYLSNTELSYLYTPGTAPLVFEVDGIRFGTALCIEANFPELFEQYERHCHVGGRRGRILEVDHAGGGSSVVSALPSYKGHRYPVEVISDCVW
ncbi:nitrilase-related carbon-nitrogen hydrolase, partial [Streptomyces sp. NPDC056831]|uniref:nitrilase-related carbon-nitrogen hydrolase n=1 Tax=Streptomyces sp. NPDC056831 TaxID=3345954 RepID=UPI0036997174